MNAFDDGYSIHEGVFDREEMTRVLDALHSSDVARTRAGARHVLAVPAVRTLASDRRLLNIATLYVGVEAAPYRATLFDKSAASNWLVAWHQDTALPIRNRVEASAWGPWSVKRGVLHAIAPSTALRRVIALRVHLDDSTAENGPLRVLPGRDTRGVLSAHEISELAATVDAVDCLTSAGGVVAMRPLTVHASSKARDVQPRRVVHIEHAADVHFDGGIELAAV